MKCLLFLLILGGVCWARVHADRRVTFRVAAPNAQKVQVRLGGAHDMTKGADGLWMVTIPPKTSNNGVFADAEAFNKKMKVLFLGIGSVEGPGD
jgi:hypothetical protein